MCTITFSGERDLLLYLLLRLNSTEVSEVSAALTAIPPVEISATSERLDLDDTCNWNIMALMFDVVNNHIAYANQVRHLHGTTLEDGSANAWPSASSDAHRSHFPWQTRHWDFLLRPCGKETPSTVFISHNYSKTLLMTSSSPSGNLTHVKPECLTLFPKF